MGPMAPGVTHGQTVAFIRRPTRVRKNMGAETSARGSDVSDGCSTTQASLSTSFKPSASLLNRTNR